MSKKIYIGDAEIAGGDGKSAYQSWLDQGNTGTEADFLTALKGAKGDTGVGFQSITTQQDGTLIITLTDGNTITIDLNHNHPQYLKYVYLTSESQMPATPDSTTLYLIKDNA